MQLHQLRFKNKNKDKKRIARGGKRGTTSGRGQKGQKSRSGHRIRPAERDMVLKFPKLRAQKKPAMKKRGIRILNIADIRKKISGVIDKKSLFEAGFIASVETEVKILGKGKADDKVRIEGLAISKKAKEKIEKAGGSVKL
jgi:large subunit ribosomal protein L15